MVINTIRAAVESDSDTLTRPADTDSGDHDRFAHYVRKSDIPSSAINGQEGGALCGKKWVPTRLTDEYPVCPDCKKIYDQLRSSD